MDKTIATDNQSTLNNESFHHQDTIRLPVLDSLLNRANVSETQKILKKTIIYYVHHPLQTSINVIDSLVSLGVSYENIFILGKKYSECDEVVDSLIARGVHYQPCSKQTRIGQFATSFIRDINWLWFRLTQNLSSSIENILILDHGGHAVHYMPVELLERHRVIGIEKTSAGFFELNRRGTPPFPMIDVANCFAKKHLESPLIAKTIVNKLFALLPKPKNNFYYGVVGLGAIGAAIIEQLIEQGQNLFVFDLNSELMKLYQNDPRIECAKDTNQLIEKCDWIFGCSGRDITEAYIDQLDLTKRDKTFISCSSEDKEFLSLLRHIDKQTPIEFNPLDTIKYHSEQGAVIRLLRGGFPINFDGTGESVPANEIQLTRSLVIGAVLQAIRFLGQYANIEKAAIYPLNIEVQRFIVYHWLLHQNELGVDQSLIEKYTKLYLNIK